MTSSEHPQIVVDGTSVRLDQLDEFGFSARWDLPENTELPGTLVLTGQEIDVEFRVRRNQDGLASGSFLNLSLAAADQIKQYLRQRERGFVANGLDSRSYDELAEGLIDDRSSDASAQSNNAGDTVVSTGSHENAAATGGVKSIVMLLMLVGLIGLMFLAGYFLKSRSSLAVVNSALVGNYLPINVNVEGEISELLVGEGDMVEKGDILLRLKNPAMEVEQEHCLARMLTAESKVSAIKNKLKAFDKKLAMTARKLALDFEVAKSEADSADKYLQAAKGNLSRMKVALSKGAVTQAEYDISENEYLAADAAWLAAKNTTKQIEFSQRSLEDKVLILGGRVDDEISGLRSELEIAQAELKEMKLAVDVGQRQFAELEVTAPRRGQVYVTYRQVGEFVKVADETIGLSYDGQVWAAGQVTVSQSRRVRPGQRVTVSAPSLGQRFEGVVLAVGHRAMYSQGHYTADFRSENATDVPVKVRIDDLPENIPSGIRLEMAINTGFGIEWLDQALGYELQPVSDSSTSATSESVSTRQADRRSASGKVAIAD